MSFISLKLEQYKKANSLSDVAQILGLRPSHLSYVLYKVPASEKYHQFTVIKKSGGMRTIDAPTPALKLIQRKLTKDLLLIEQQIEARRTNNRCILAHGFKTNLSIATNGHNHRRRRYVFNVDLKDFFPSINFGRVYGFFTKNNDFRLNPKVATIISQIACHENKLPQGSPCSPVISNLIANILDIRLNDLSKRNRCTYTRYADDLTFSTNEKIFPRAIGRDTIGSMNLWEAGTQLISCIERAGFEINPNKTRMQYQNSRQSVTGVVVNQKVNIPADYYATVHAMCDHLFKTGSCHVNIDGIKRPYSTNSLRGRLAYIYQIRGKGPKADDGSTEKGKINSVKYENAWASYKLFERFLNYADLYGENRPVILCEGVTDNIYIKSAIQALAPKYPGLITNTTGDLKINLFKYTRTSAAVQQLSGGSGELVKLARTYATRTKLFKSGGNHPVILIADFDEGSKDLFAHVKSKTKKAVDGSDSWYHLESNLYVLPVPRIGGVDTPIERLFDQELLDSLYDGKKFDMTNSETDGGKFFSKKTFATKVVAANKSSINFARFEPLLDAIEAIKRDYTSRIASTAFSASA
jgi:RNA-directed DNA polymerase